MCGRFTLTSPASKLVEFFATLEPEFQLEPRYNIAPTQMTPAIVEQGGARLMRLMRWGLVPSWAKHLSEGARMINARAETIDSKPAFRKAFRKRRCLIPADGFFEWKKVGKDKQPYLIGMSNEEPFAFAGLWERWHDPESENIVESYSVVTTAPNQLMVGIHDRMPAILPAEACHRWLNDATPDSERLDLLSPYPAGDMRAFPVHRSVGNVRNDTPLCISRIETRTQKELF